MSVVGFDNIDLYGNRQRLRQTVRFVREKQAIGAYGGDSPLTIAERKRMREAAAPACNIV
jgi:hypothetical protein